MPPPRCAETDDMQTMLPLFCVSHLRNDRLRHVERAAQVHVDDSIEVARFNVHRLQRLGDAGVVDQSVDAAVLLDDCLRRCNACVLVGHVAGEAEVLFAQIARGALGVFLLKVQDHHSRALCGERFGGRLADTAWRGCTGDDYYFAVEQHVCLHRSC